MKRVDRYYLEIPPVKGPVRKAAVALARVVWFFAEASSALGRWLDRRAYRLYWLGDTTGQRQLESEMSGLLEAALRGGVAPKGPGSSDDGEWLQ